MTSPIPSVRSHLLRKIMNEILLREHGDAMACMAISTREAFSIFKNIIGSDVVAIVENLYMEPKNLYFKRNVPRLKKDGYGAKERAENFYKPKPRIRFTGYLYELIQRYIRKLHVAIDLFSFPDLSFLANVTELIIDNKHHYISLRFNKITDWSKLEVVKIEYISDEFLDDILCGTTQLSNLRCLDLRVAEVQLRKMLTKPGFPFPENVTLRCTFGVKNNVSIDNVTFPQVKHFQFEGETADHFNLEQFWMLQQVVGCFPSIDLVKITLSSLLPHFPRNHKRIVIVHEWFFGFGVPLEIEINYHAKITLKTYERVEDTYKSLKDYGFKEDDTPYALIFEKTYFHVKLVHRVAYRPEDLLNCNSEDEETSSDSTENELDEDTDMSSSSEENEPYVCPSCSKFT